MKNKKIDELQSMMGKHFKNKHNDEVAKFLSMKVMGDQITIATDGDWILTTPFELNTFFQKYEEVEVSVKGEVSKIIPKETGMIRSITIPENTFAQLKDVLLENIQNVRANRDYVSQAKEISNSVGQLINLAKVEIEMKTKL